MSTDFERALDHALREDGASPGDLATLSGPSREEADLFVSRLAAEQGERKRLLFERMVRSSEADFQLDYHDLFRPFLGDADPLVRRYAVEGLWEYDRADLVAPLLALLGGDPDVMVRAAAALSLGRYLFLGECEELDERLTRRIEGALRVAAEDADEDVEVRRRAVESLAYINEETWVHRLIDAAYTHPDTRMRESAVFAMGRNAEMIWAEMILEELHSEHAAMRYEAARASGELELQRAVERLIELLDDVDAEVQDMAIWALGQIGGRRARAALEACVAHGSEALAAAAAEALDEMEFASRPMELFVHEAGEELPPDEGEDLYDALTDEDEALGDGEDDEWASDDEYLDL